MKPADLKALRKRLGMSQEIFSRFLGYHTRGAVCIMEKRQKDFTGPLLGFLRFLNSLPSDLVKQKAWELVKQYDSKVLDVKPPGWPLGKKRKKRRKEHK